MSNLTAIILSAGMGTRLGERTRDLPKALVKVNGRPLVSYAINFLKELGVGKIVVVGGFGFDKLEKVVKQIDKDIVVCKNDNYKIGNLYSLEKALQYVDGGFLVWHVDHIFPKTDVSRVSGLFKNEIIAVCDNGEGRSLKDEMKVFTDKSGEILKKVSKKLKDYSLAYIGITYCPGNYLSDYKKALEKAVIKLGDMAKTEDVMQVIADENTTDVCIGDISGHRWFEIDYPEELAEAEKEICLNKDLYL